MAGITLAQAETQLAAWLAASEAIATGQSYTISTGAGSRTLQRADLEAVQAQIQYWDAQIKRLTRGGIRMRGATIVRG